MQKSYLYRQLESVPIACSTTNMRTILSCFDKNCIKCFIRSPHTGHHWIIWSIFRAKCRLEQQRAKWTGAHYRIEHHFSLHSRWMLHWKCQRDDVCYALKTCLQQIDSSRRGANAKFCTFLWRAVELCWVWHGLARAENVCLCRWMYVCEFVTGDWCLLLATCSACVSMQTLVYFNIWILTISEHIFPAACPRIIIKYLAYKCARTLHLSLFIEYLWNFRTNLAPDFSI